MNKTSIRHAFTLIELLVSVAIISSLMAVLLPSVGAARREGQRIACQNNLRQMSQALWAYSVANDSRSPYIVSPMTNGGSVPGYGNAAYTDEQVDPYNRDLWPMSFQNLMMPLYLGSDSKVFVCPAATRGWPRDGNFRLSYRDAGINQPNGFIDPPGTYRRENFGFMDGRPMNELRIHFTGNIITDAELIGRARGTFMRDMVTRHGSDIAGPHNKGVNVITREFGIEFRDYKSVTEDLGTFGAGVAF